MLQNISNPESPQNIIYKQKLIKTSRMKGAHEFLTVHNQFFGLVPISQSNHCETVFAVNYGKTVEK